MRHFRKTIIAFLLACAISSAFLTVQSGTATTSQSSATPTSKKQIKDPAEYDAYIAALNEQDTVKKAAQMEAFVQLYPQSVVKIDALEQAMAAYQQAGNAAKVEDTARRIIVIEPAHVRALAILAYITRAKGTPEAAKEALAYAERGLAGLKVWTIPNDTSEADFQKLRTQMSLIFYGASAWGHLQAREFGAARDNYLKAVQIDPTDFQNMFQLAYAELEMNPIDLNGFWYAVKAANLAQAANNAPGAKQILDYARAKYRRYHGDNDGWDAFVASVATQKAPPSAADLANAITKAPTPCELAVKAVKEYKPEDLSFADYEFVLQYRDCSPANKDAADKVWATIQEKQKNGEAKIRLNGVKVIAATRDTIDAALTDDNQQANKADLHVVMETPMLRPPAPGSMIDVIGVLTSYTPAPFRFTMEKAELPAAQ
jgi:hypothetical protein